jgi:hypothetical protein
MLWGSSIIFSMQSIDLSIPVKSRCSQILRHKHLNHRYYKALHTLDVLAITHYQVIINKI